VRKTGPRVWRRHCLILLWHQFHTIYHIELLFSRSAMQNLPRVNCRMMSSIVSMKNNDQAHRIRIDGHRGWPVVQKVSRYSSQLYDSAKYFPIL